MVWLPLLFEILASMSIVIICFQVCDVVTFDIPLLSYQVVFLLHGKCQDKNLNILTMKTTLKVK